MSQGLFCGEDAHRSEGSVHANLSDLNRDQAKDFLTLRGVKRETTCSQMKDKWLFCSRRHHCSLKGSTQIWRVTHYCLVVVFPVQWQWGLSCGSKWNAHSCSSPYLVPHISYSFNYNVKATKEFVRQKAADVAWSVLMPVICTHS